MSRKYYIGKENLKQWCTRMNYPYQQATKYVRENPDYTDEALEEYLKGCKPKAKYYYNGVGLSQYCKANNLVYSKILLRVEKIIENEKLEPEKAVKKALEDYKDTRIIFYYEGIPLKKYCEDRGYSYQKIYVRIKNIEDEEIRNKMIEEFIKNNPTNVRHHYSIGGISLAQYCKNNGYVYPTVKTYIQNILKENPNLSRNEAALQAIEFYKKNHVSKERYFYNGERLVDYCKRNNLDYKVIILYLIHYVKDSYNLTDEEIEKAIYKYRIKIRKESIYALDTKNSLEECIEILNTLKIDLDSVKLVMNFELEWKEAILFVWYFGKEDDGCISIQIERIQEVYHNLYNLDSLEIDELIGYYKTKIKDTREIIYKKSFLSIRKIVSDICKLYNVKDNNMKEELKSIADNLFIEFIENTTSRYLGQIINYMNGYIRGCLKRYLTKELENVFVSLNEHVPSKSRKTQERIEKLIITPNVDSEYISDELLEIIKTLSELEQRFIIMKYQMQYDDKEIAQYLQLDKLELEELNVSVLEKLRENEDIKKLIKR